MLISPSSSASSKMGVTLCIRNSILLRMLLYCIVFNRDCTLRNDSCLALLFYFPKKDKQCWGLRVPFRRELAKLILLPFSRFASWAGWLFQSIMKLYTLGQFSYIRGNLQKEYEGGFELFLNFAKSIRKCLSNLANITSVIHIQFNKTMQKNWSDPITLGPLTLKNRVFLAALTRERCDLQTNIPSPLVAEYYAQRAGAGLMLTEATAWSERGKGFFGAACLYNRQHLEGWKLALDAVHAKGGLLFLQIFHAGRVTHPLKNNNLQAWAPSAIAVKETIRDIGNKQFPTPKEMTLEDIETLKQQFQESIKLAKQAGFDGVQLHGAHGYIIDEFLRTSANQRKDHYGGSAQNRVRLCLQLTDIALKYFQPARLGIKISPASRLKDMYDENPIETYSLLLKELDKRKVGFVEVRESTQFYPFPNKYPLSQRQQIPDVCAAFRPCFSGLLIGNDNFDEKSGLQKIRSGLCDAISFGRLYISNPDLAERINNGWEINRNWDMSTFYDNKSGAKGYTDYPFYQKHE